MLRAAPEEERGADQAARRPQSRAQLPPCGEGYRWCCLQALQDSCCAQIHRQGLHCDAPEAEGELEEVLQGKNPRSFKLNLTSVIC